MFTSLKEIQAYIAYNRYIWRMQKYSQWFIYPLQEQLRLKEVT